jgi:predicted AlkP superfamily phosphohydrolase/phosphomutase
MSTPRYRPVLMIGLDAAEPRLIERWMEDGTLPVLRGLRDRGTYGRLSSSAGDLGGSPWPTFYTSRTPAEHGFYSYLAWRPDVMASSRPTRDYLPITPFWRTLSRQGPRVVAVDVPLTYEPEPFNGVEVANWGTHDAIIGSMTSPPALMDELRREFGAPPRENEEYGLLPVEELLAIRDQQSRVVDSVAGLTLELMRRERWDLFLAVFASCHRAGHKLWDDTGAEGEVLPERAAELAGSLRQVYGRVDAAIGRLVEAAGEGTTVLVFSLHGMGENTSRADLLPEMLRRVLAGGPPAAAGVGKPGLLKRVRELVPNRWRHGVKKRLPLALQDWLTAFWRVGRVDWSATRAFCLVADLQGYVRLNVRGREAEGIVSQGQEYDRLCAEIAEGLSTFVSADSGQPVVLEVVRADRLYPGGERRDLLPDLIVQWSRSGRVLDRAISSPRYGTIDLPTPGKNTDGRGGNHRPHGFLLAAGPGVGHGQLGEAHIMDLAPTVYSLFGISPPAEMRGRVIGEVVSRRS